MKHEELIQVITNYYEENYKELKNRGKSEWEIVEYDDKYNRNGIFFYLAGYSPKENIKKICDAIRKVDRRKIAHKIYE